MHACQDVVRVRSQWGDMDKLSKVGSATSKPGMDAGEMGRPASRPKVGSATARPLVEAKGSQEGWMTGCGPVEVASATCSPRQGNVVPVEGASATRNPRRGKVTPVEGASATRNPRQGRAWKSVRFGPTPTQNRFSALEDDGDVDGDVSAVNEEIGEVVEVTVGSGASKSVWPMTRKGVVRTQLKKNIRLAAANGTSIAVKGRQNSSSKDRAGNNAR